MAVVDWISVVVWSTVVGLTMVDVLVTVTLAVMVVVSVVVSVLSLSADTMVRHPSRRVAIQRTSIGCCSNAVYNFFASFPASNING